MSEKKLHELGIEGVKKRKRARQACAICRKKKIKCDSTKPECVNCQDAGITCEYTENKKRGPRKGYVHLLEDRLAQIEGRLVSKQDTGSFSSTISGALPPMAALATLSKQDITLPPYDIVMELVDLFFKYINSMLPIIHRPTLKHAIQTNSVSKHLLLAVMATSARFSNNPRLKTNPPYLAGDKFAAEAMALVDASCLEPTQENVQFWGIMAWLEYGCGSGSKAWLYSGMAGRLCQDLGYNKEQTLSRPIVNSDGSINTMAMAERRRAYWTCFSIDRLSTASTNRSQCFDRMDCDAQFPSTSETITLRDSSFYFSVHGKPITTDSLLGITLHFMKAIELFGQVNKYMHRAKSCSTSILWPPIPEFDDLDKQLQEWTSDLPQLFRFTSENFTYHIDHAGGNYFNVWLCTQAIWYSSKMLLHRGSLTYSEMSVSDFPSSHTYNNVLESIETCKMCVKGATDTFHAIKDFCGYNVMPHMGYTAYIFATLLMTSVFSKTPEACEKSYSALKVLYDLIEGLAPYWPMCERLARMTKEMLTEHGRLYEAQVKDKQQSQLTRDPTGPGYAQFGRSALETLPTTSPTSSSLTSSPILSFRSTPTSMPLGSLPASTQPLSDNFRYCSEPMAGQNPWLPSGISNPEGNGINFDSWEFLNNDALFGQVMLDVNRPYVAPGTDFSTMTVPAGPGSDLNSTSSG